MKPINWILCLLLTISLVAPGLGASLRWAGVVGNSGAQGKSLIRGINGRGGGGVVLDPQGRLLTAAGDRIIMLDKAGKLLWEDKLPADPAHAESNWVIGGSTMALQGDYLYFFAGVPDPYQSNITFGLPTYGLLRPNLMRINIAEQSAPEIIIPAEQIQWLPWTPNQWHGMEFTVAANPKDGGIYIGWNTNVTGPVKDYGVDSSRAYENFSSRYRAQTVSAIPENNFRRWDGAGQICIR